MDLSGSNQEISGRSAGTLSISPRLRPPLTIAVINYNGGEVLRDTLEALLRIEYGNELHLLLFDDCSTDGSAEWARESYPQVQVVSLPTNGKKPSRVRNRALSESPTRYVFLIDNDVALDPECPGRLMDFLASRPAAFACSPRLLYSDDAERIYYDGAGVHYLGITSRSIRGARVREHPATEPFHSIPGGIALVDRERAREIGFFDEGYDFGWGEDGELYVRAHLAGFPSFHVPKAMARHVERERGTKRAEAQLYNRYRLILTAYSHRSLLFLAPALLGFELCVAAMSLATGVFPAYARAVLRTVRNRHELSRERARIQRMRRLSDREVLNADDFFPTGALARNAVVAAGVRVVRAVFVGYWGLVRRAL